MIENVKVWNDEALVEFQEEGLGRVVEVAEVLRGIREAKGENGNLEVVDGRGVRDFEVHSKKVVVQMDDGERFSTKLLVESEGNLNVVKDNSNASSYGWSYNQMDLVCTIKLNQNLTTAFQRYKDGNILSILPLWNSYASIVWTV